MESERDREIEARAYALWEQGGRQDGHADAHWAQATREIGSAGPDTNPSAASTPRAGDAPKAAAKGLAKPAAKDPAKSLAKAPAAKSGAPPLESAAVAKKPAASARTSAKP